MGAAPLLRRVQRPIWSYSVSATAVAGASASTVGRRGGGATSSSAWRAASTVAAGRTAEASRAAVSPVFLGPFRDNIGVAAVRAAEDGIRDPKFWSSVSVELYQRLRKLSPRNITLVLNALARVGIRDEALLEHIASTLGAAWLRSFNSQDLALLCNSFARADVNSERLLGLCAHELLWKLPDASPQELASVANAYARLRSYDPTLFRHVAALAVRASSRCEPRHAANLLHAFARVDAPSRELFDSFAERLLASNATAELEAVGVAHAAFAVGRATPAAGGRRALLEALSRRLVALLERPGDPVSSSAVESRHIAVLARACLQAGAHSRRLIDLLARALEARRAAQSSDAGSVRPRLQQHRRQLLDIVDAAASLRASLEQSSVVLGEAEPSSERTSLETTLMQALEELAAGAATAAGRNDERRRLTPLDRQLSSWLPAWSERLRPVLLGKRSSSRDAAGSRDGMHST